MNIPIRLRIYLPNGYDPGRAQPYDVLYLLHGGNGDFDDWSRPSEGNVTGIVDAQSAFNGIVVMPEGGDAGWYSNWYGYTTDNFRTDWETFHLDQLVPWVDANFNTSDTAAGRAIAGLSMGGFGALKYAGTNPGLFSAIGSFSGPADLRNEAFQFIVALSMTGRGATVGEGAGDPYGEAYTGSKYLVSDTEYSPPETAALGPESSWPSINPVQLAEEGAYDAYTGEVYLYSGDGAGSFFDPFEQAIKRDRRRPPRRPRRRRRHPSLLHRSLQPRLAVLAGGLRGLLGLRLRNRSPRLHRQRQLGLRALVRPRPVSGPGCGSLVSQFW